MRKRTRLSDLIAEAALGLLIAAVALAVLVAAIRPVAFVYQGY
jgi:hypothetical protein